MPEIISFSDVEKAINRHQNKNDQKIILDYIDQLEELQDNELL
jgi:hypothetical protein